MGAAALFHMHTPSPPRICMQEILADCGMVLKEWNHAVHTRASLPAARPARVPAWQSSLMFAHTLRLCQAPALLAKDRMQYQVDAEDRIVALCQEWDAFAIANQDMKQATRQGAIPGTGPVASRVLGRPLFDFITGDATRLFMHAVLDGVRIMGRPRILPYRCDSALERRWYEMEAQPLADGGVRVLHRLLDSQPRQAPPLLCGKRWRCSQCLASRPLGRKVWVQEDVATGEVVGFDVCPACSSRLFGGEGLAGEPTAGGAHGR